jgi:globin
LDQDEIFNLSYWRVTSNKLGGVPFVDAFSDALARSSEEVARKMSGGDLDRFRTALGLAIVHLASYYAKDKADAVLQGIAERHSRRGRDVRPDLYEHFMRALLETVAHYDPEHNDEVRVAWETVLRPGIEYMKRMY